jgi:DNA-binding transcriptional MerR regulator/methylmalonyl-CoA mutase cobalamin-binding subunit
MASVIPVSIKTVSRRTGLTSHVIRAWERRSQAIEPERSQGRHRKYTERDVERLNLLTQAVRTGKLISRVAKMSNEELRSILENAIPDTQKGLHSEAPPESGALIEAAWHQTLDAIRSLDAHRFDSALQGALISLGDQGVLRRLIAPMARTVGALWNTGRMTAAQEHFFTASARAFIWNITRQYTVDDSAPRIVVGTPSGQLHELGAVIAAAAAANAGWKVAFIGPNLPAFELAGAVQTVNANVLLLSLVYPEDDPKLPQELKSLKRLLPPHVSVIIGGRASSAYLDTIQKIGATLLSSLEDLDTNLDRLRKASFRAGAPNGL